VAICAADTELSAAVADALEAGGHEIVASVSAVDGLAEACRGSSVACVVLGAERADVGSAKAASVLQDRVEARSCVLVCRRATNGHVRRALEIGVMGVVLESQLNRALAAVVAVVDAGQVSVPAETRSSVRPASLTTREKQILSLVVMGMTNGEIARKLYLAESTVKSHLSSAFAKLDVSSRNEAVGVILDPERGRGLGILGIPADRVPTPA
jgi:DNA-binding NarL/FixJ family response regulator